MRCIGERRIEDRYTKPCGHTQPELVHTLHLCLLDKPETTKGILLFYFMPLTAFTAKDTPEMNH